MSPNDLERRQALATFLRTRREKLSPADVGLPPGSRRRTSGLRREEVAILANVGVAWYTSLEQGREIRPSRSVLTSIAEALLLTPDEKRHLFLLADQPLPAAPPPFQERVSQPLQKIVDDLQNNPAYVLGRRWDLLAWNRAAELVFSFSQISPPHSRNLLWYIFTGPRRKEIYLDWEQIAENVVAQFRADLARYPGDDWFTALVEDLQATSPEFRRLWSQYNVLSKVDGPKLIGHPAAGPLVLEHTSLSVSSQPDQRLMIYTPAPRNDTAARLQALLSAPALV